MQAYYLPHSTVDLNPLAEHGGDIDPHMLTSVNININTNGDANLQPTVSHYSNTAAEINAVLMTGSGAGSSGAGSSNVGGTPRRPNYYVVPDAPVVSEDEEENSLRLGKKVVHLLR